MLKNYARFTKYSWNIRWNLVVQRSLLFEYIEYKNVHLACTLHVILSHERRYQHVQRRTLKLDFIRFFIAKKTAGRRSSKEYFFKLFYFFQIRESNIRSLTLFTYAWGLRIPHKKHFNVVESYDFRAQFT